MNMLFVLNFTDLDGTLSIDNETAYGGGSGLVAGTDFKSDCEAAAPSLVCSIRTRPRQKRAGGEALSCSCFFDWGSI